MHLMNNKLYFVLPLIATVAKGDYLPQGSCHSFDDAAAFNATDGVVSAPGFVESFAIPAGWEHHDQRIELIKSEYANGTVTTYPTAGRRLSALLPQTHHLDFQEKLKLEVRGTEGNPVNWPGHNTSSRIVNEVTTVSWTAFMDYFAAGGSGVVIDLENYSTLSARGSSTGTPYGVAQPANLTRVAIAVQYTTEVTITISNANVLTVTAKNQWDDMHGGERVQNPLWSADDNGLWGVNVMPGVAVVEWRPNSCHVFDTSLTTPTPTSAPSAPTPSPTASGAAGLTTTRSRGLALFSLLVAASLALRSS